jgi:TolB protein
MRRYLIILTLLCSSCRVGKSYDVCYTQGSLTMLLSQADRKEDTLKNDAFDPDLSPDGSKVAYTKYGNNDVRQIAVADLTNGTTTILDSACKNCYAPVWSPDGKKVAYNAFTTDHWSILLLDLDGTAPPVNLTKGLNAKEGAYSPTWSNDGKKLLVQDMTNVYILDPTGKVMDSIPIASFGEGSGASSNSKFILTGEETRIVFDTETDDTTAEDGPPSAIFVYDRTAKKAKRISPRGYDCFQPYLKGDRVFFTGIHTSDPAFNKDNPVIDIYSSAISGGHFRLEFKNRQDYSCKR